MARTRALLPSRILPLVPALTLGAGLALPTAPAGAAMVLPGPPTVRSADYPGPEAGGPGIPGTFTFAPAPGDSGVVAYRWGDTSPIEEVAAGPDGTATITFTPEYHGRQFLYVQAVDGDRNRSPVVTYMFVVRNTMPMVTDLLPDGGIGEARTLILAPRLADTVEWSWWLDGGERTTVPADADGKASITVTPDRPGELVVHIMGRTADGTPSARADYTIYPQTAPRLSSPDLPDDGSEPPLVGQRLTFTLRPGMPGVTEYVVKVRRRPEFAVPATADGTATFTWTEPDSTNLTIEVHSRTAEGVESDPRTYDFPLTGHRPQIASDDYPAWSTSGGPGVPGTFTFHPARPGVTAYTYAFDDGEPHPVPAGADGTGAITWTPAEDQAGRHTLRVREHVGDTVSEAAEWEFGVAGQQQNGL